MQHRAALIAALLAPACTGSAPPDPVDTPVGPLPPRPAEIRGQTLDLFSATPLGVGDVAIEFDGTAAHAESDPGGAFTAEVAPGSVVYPIAERTGFRPTRSPAVLALEGSTQRDVYLVAAVQLTSMSLAIAGTDVSTGTAAVFADLRRFGEPITGVALSAIALVDERGAPVGARGPFVVDITGEVDVAATATAATFGGRAVVGWLDCPVGTWRISLAGSLLPQNVICDPGGATIVDTSIAGEPTLPPTPTFTSDIYPTLGRPSIDPRGLACTACHEQLAVAAGTSPIAYDDVPSAVYAALFARASGQPAGQKIIDLEQPEQSLLLRRPLYEPPPASQDHPNATLIDTRVFEYRLILRWLAQGARE